MLFSTNTCTVNENIFFHKYWIASDWQCRSWDTIVLSQRHCKDPLGHAFMGLIVGGLWFLGAQDLLAVRELCHQQTTLQYFPSNMWRGSRFGMLPYAVVIVLVQFSRSVMSDSLQPHEPQHARPPCLSPTPGVHPNPCLLSQWYHPAISSSVVPFSSCLQSFPASGSFLRTQLFTSGGQSTEVSASTSVLPMTIQYWFPLAWAGLISLQSKGLSRVFFNTTVQKHPFFCTQLFL